MKKIAIWYLNRIGYLANLKAKYELDKQLLCEEDILIDKVKKHISNKASVRLALYKAVLDTPATLLKSLIEK